MIMNMIVRDRSFVHSALVIGLAGWILGACATDDANGAESRWTKPNNSQAQAAVDSEQCRDAAAAEQGGRRPDATTASPFPGGGSTFPAASDPGREQAAFDRCMTGRGYAKIQ